MNALRHIIGVLSLLFVLQGSAAAADEIKYTASFAPTGENHDKTSEGLRELAEAIPITINTATHALSYDLAKVNIPQDCILRIHGFAPVGWEAPVLATLPIENARAGVWSYPEKQEVNILAGLTYFSLCGRPPHAETAVAKDTLSDAVAVKAHRIAPKYRAQIQRPQLKTRSMLDAELQDFRLGATTDSAGGCNMAVEMFGLLEPTKVEMDPASVRLVRAPAGDFNNNGRLDSQLSITVRTGGGFVPKIGRVQVEIVADDSPGIIEANAKDSVFPASLKFYLKKRYKTPYGTFVGERETYVAENITQFPPYGAQIRPTSESVRLLDEKTGKHVGNIYLGSIVPLFNLPEGDFPLKSPVDLRPIGGEPRFFKMTPVLDK